MAMVRRIWRLLLLISFLLLGGLLTLLLFADVKQGIPGEKVQKVRQWWYGRILRVMGVEPVVRGKPTEQPSLWVANHISWLDIPLLGSLASLGFLSKAEIRQWPLIGWLAASTGTLFIERGGKNASQRAAQAIAEHIRQGHSILVFPEAMTTAGETVKRFHPRLFAPAIDHGLMVQPVAIRYFHEDGSRHERLPFVDQQPFFSNLWAVLAERRSRAEVTFFEPVDAGQYIERRPLAEHVHTQVLKAFAD